MKDRYLLSQALKAGRDWYLTQLQAHPARTPPARRPATATQRRRVRSTSQHLTDRNVLYSVWLPQQGISLFYFLLPSLSFELNKEIDTVNMVERLLRNVEATYNTSKLCNLRSLQVFVICLKKYSSQVFMITKAYFIRILRCRLTWKPLECVWGFSNKQVNNRIYAPTL